MGTKAVLGNPVARAGVVANPAASSKAVANPGRTVRVIPLAFVTVVDLVLQLETGDELLAEDGSVLEMES